MINNINVSSLQTMHYNHNVVINDNDVRVRMINSTFFATRVSHDSDTNYKSIIPYKLYSIIPFVCI